MTDMDTAAGEGLRRRRAGGREGHARNAAPQQRPWSQPRMPYRPTEVDLRGRAGIDPHRVTPDPVGDRHGLPRRRGARSAGRGRGDGRSGHATRPLRPRDGHRGHPDRAVDVHPARLEPGPRHPPGRRLDGVRDRRQPAERRRPGSRPPHRQPESTTRTCSVSASRSTRSTSWPGYPVEPVDIHHSVRYLHATHDALTLMDKPIHAYSLGRQRNIDTLEMVRIARGVDDATLDLEPSIFTVVNSSSPLRLDAPDAAGHHRVRVAQPGRLHHPVHTVRARWPRSRWPAPSRSRTPRHWRAWS